MNNIMYSNNGHAFSVNGHLIGSNTQPVPPGPTWKTVTIGDNVWMSEILAIDDGGTGIDVRDNVTVNGNNLGQVYYYSYDAAVRIANLINGYHLPTKEETDDLVEYVGGYNSTTCVKLKSTNIWSNPGTNDYGFNAIPYGMIDHGNPSYGNESTFWNDNNGTSNRMYITNNNSMSNGYENGDNYKYPLRLVKD